MAAVPHTATAGAHALDDDHAEISKLAKSLLKASTSTLRGSISAHQVGTRLTFPSLLAFCTAVQKARSDGPATCVFVSSREAALTVSVQLSASWLRPLDAAHRGKRGRRHLDADERAERICKPLHAAATCTHRKRHIDAAQTVVSRVIGELWGDRGECLLEACAVSLASVPAPPPPAAAPAAPPPAAASRVVLTCRLSAGMPISLASLKRGLGSAIEDGMLTTNAHELAQDYKLPLCDYATVAEANGQTGLLMLACVPPPSPPPLAKSTR